MVETTDDAHRNARMRAGPRGQSHQSERSGLSDARLVAVSHYSPEKAGHRLASHCSVVCMDLEVVIEPSRRLGADLKALWRRRELLYFFIWRALKLRYKQTALGVIWALLQPLVMMLVLTFFFHRAGKIDVGSTPYPIFAFTGLIYWYYFSNALAQTGQSLLTNQSIISRVYFPRLMPTIAASAVPLVDLVCSTVVLAGLMVWFGIYPGLLGVILFLPMLLLLALFTWGVGLAIAALSVRYRDLQQAIPFFVQTLFFATPIIYPLSSVPAGIRRVFYLNPVASVISVMRVGLIGYGAIDWRLFSLSVLSTAVIFLIGIAYFKRQERNLVDIL